MELNKLTISKLLELLKQASIEQEEIINCLRARIRHLNPSIQAYVRVDEDGCLVSATGSASPVSAAGSGSLLEGIPISLKDNICTKGNYTECCSQVLKGFKPPYDAAVVKRLRSAGASILNVKNNMDEFAFGSSTENSCFGPTRNPWNTQRVVGGSSGGSTAAVAADMAVAALGSDTGGSIRQPASFCGVVGLKPSYGRVSRSGLIAFASSLDQIGPITKDVKDSALLLGAIAGYDPADSTSADIDVPDYTRSLVEDIKGLRIGVPREYLIEGIDDQVKSITLKAIDKLKQLGATVKEINLAHTKYAVPVYYIIATAEASSNLARFDGVQYGLRATAGQDSTDNALISMYKATRGAGFGQEAKRRIILGTYALSYGYYEAYYLRAQKVRTLIKQDFDKAFETVDCIVTPTTPTVAFKINEKKQDPLKMYLSDVFTINANLAGIPAISLPCGFSSDGLPAGLQILTKNFDEETLFRVAYTYEQNTDWHLRKPKL